MSALSVSLRRRTLPAVATVGRRTVPVLAAVAAALVVWWPLTIPLEGFLPTPIAVARSFVEAWTDGAFYGDLLATMRRITIGWTSSVVIGSTVGIWMGRSRVFEAFALPWAMIGLALPAPVIILFSLLLFGLEESSALLALFISVVPFVINIVYGGVRGIDPGLQDMARVYRFSWGQRMRQVILPQIAPSLLAGTRFGFAMSWKIVVIVEALSQPDGIGSALTLFFRLLRADRVLAWTLAFTVIMVAVEFLLFRPVEKRLFRWRAKAAL